MFAVFRGPQANGAPCIAYRRVLQLLKDHRLFDADFSTPLAIRCFASLTDRPETYAGQEMEFLDSDLSYDEFLEGLVRCADLKHAGLVTPEPPAQSPVDSDAPPVGAPPSH